MKKLFFSLLSAFLSAGAILAGDIIYVKAGATGVGDGSSWVNAYTDPADAITDGNASGKTIYIARGLYTLSKGLFVTTGLSIYGGFAGESLDETIEGRDIEGDRTIFSGDINKSHYWVHYTPNNYSLINEELTDAPLIVNDTLSMPPAFTGDYDGYRINTSSTDATLCLTALELSGGACKIDGITFTGFRANKDVKANNALTAYAILNIATTSINSTISNCSFIGNYSDYGVIYSGRAITINNCDFLYNFASYRSSGISVHGGRTIVNNCYFLNSLSTFNAGAGNVFNGWGGGFTVNRTTVERCALVLGNSFQQGYGGPGNLFSAEAGSETIFNDCIIKDLYTGGSNANCVPTVSAGSGSLLFNRCLFSGIKQVVKPGANSCYTIFGATKNDRKMYFSACTFSENSIEAPEVALSTGKYVLTLIGNNPSILNTALVNCSFEGNTASTIEKDGVEAILCRGVTTFNSAAGVNNQTGLANCTFYGEANGTYDITQIGDGHSQDLNIVNCLFMAPGEEIANPIYAEKPELVKIYSSAIQNRFSAYEGMAVCDFTSDSVPLSKETVTTGNGFILRPNANVPSLHSTANVATNNGISASSTKMAWAFKPVNSEAWIALVSSLDTLSGTDTQLSQRLITDATTSTRPGGSFTKGAVQSLTNNGENGATLVLRKDPFASGTFSPAMAVQSVQKGSPIIPITAIPSDEKITFAGWYDDENNLFSSEAALEIPALNDDCTILTAKFSSPPVAIIFDLDGKGTFNENGLSTITVLATALSDFPEIPPHTINAGFINLGFSMPDLVPMEDTAYKARIISSDVRIIRVVPNDENAPLTQDGTSWETAYSDFNLAYEDAALYRGEIWMKTGRYLFTSPVILKSSVSVIGGFAGNETSAEEADSENNPTIITGDVNDDGYWRPNGTGGSVATHKIWNGLSYMAPNPDGTDAMWTPFGKSTDDTLQAFVSTGGAATNCCFSGLTFTLFGKNVFYLSSGNNTGFVVDNCKFIACSSVENTSSYEGPIVLINTSALIKDTLFDGCQRGISASSVSAQHISITNTIVKNGNAAQYGGQVQFYDKASALVDDCLFYRNRCSSRGYQGAAAIKINSSGDKVVVKKSKFYDNRIRGDAHATITCISGSLDIDCCEFIGNTITNANYVYENANSACIASVNAGAVNISNSLFEGNSASDQESSKLFFSSVFSMNGGGFAQFVNCTFLNNSVVENSLTSRAGTFQLNLNNANGGFALIHCVINGSTFSGEGKSWELLNDYSMNKAQIGIINSAFLNSNEEYKPLFLYSSLMPTIAGSYISNLAEVNMPALGTDGFIRNVHSDLPLPTLTAVKTNENGIKAVRAKVDFYGEPVAFSAPYHYLYDSTSPAKPWIRIGMADNKKTIAEGDSIGLRLNNLIPDAFGEKRKEKRVTPGPLNGPNPTTFILLK